MQYPNPYHVTFEDGEWIVYFEDRESGEVDIIDRFHGHDDAPANKLKRQLNDAHVRCWVDLVADEARKDTQ